MAKINNAHKRLLKEKFEDVANLYLVALLQMWDLSEKGGFWVADEVGGTYAYGNNGFINFDDMRYAVDNNIKEEEFSEWSDYCVWCIDVGLSYPNLKSWHMGCPRHSKDKIEHINNLKQRFEDAIKEAKESF